MDHPNRTTVLGRADVERFAREDVRAVLSEYGVLTASRATYTDSTEEIILLDRADYTRVPVGQLTRAIMDVLPHTKVWVIEQTSAWTKTESL